MSLLWLKEEKDLLIKLYPELQKGKITMGDLCEVLGRNERGIKDMVYDLKLHVRPPQINEKALKRIMKKIGGK